MPSSPGRPAGGCLKQDQYKNQRLDLLSPDRGNNGGGGYPAGASGTSRVFHWRIAGNGSGYLWDLFVLFGFGRLSVLHAANVGIVNFHSLWCVFGPFYFLFIPVPRRI